MSEVIHPNEPCMWMQVDSATPNDDYIPLDGNGDFTNSGSGIFATSYRNALIQSIVINALTHTKPSVITITPLLGGGTPIVLNVNKNITEPTEYEFGKSPGTLMRGGFKVTPDDAFSFTVFFRPQ